MSDLLGEGKKLAGEAEDQAKAHPEQADKVIEEGEQAADKATGNRFDQQVEQGGQKLEDEFGGQQTDQQAGQNQSGQSTGS
jgi:hypothetical protein